MGEEVRIMTNIELVLNMAEKNNGMVTSSEITANGIPRRVLTDMVNRQLLIKTARGLYQLPTAWEDEWLIAQYRHSKGIYSHETALFLHGYSDRTPASFNMTFPRGYHIKKNWDIPILERYAVKEIYQLGIITMESPAGHKIKVYDLEKSLCDVVRGNETFDIEIVNNAMKRYAKDKNRNLRRLMEYAKLLKVEKKIRNYMEVLL